MEKIVQLWDLLTKKLRKVSSKLYTSPTVGSTKKISTTITGADLLRQSDLQLDMKELARVGFGTAVDTLTISTAPIEEALTSCQGVLTQMDTINSSQISDEVKEIDKSFSNGDYTTGYDGINIRYYT